MTVEMSISGGTAATASLGARSLNAARLHGSAGRLLADLQDTPAEFEAE